MKKLHLLNKYDIADWYEVNDKGEVYFTRDVGKGNGAKKKGDKLKPFDNTSGYIEYHLSTSNGSRVHVQAQILVAMCYIPNPKKKPQVNHLDRNKHNNNKSNLEWVTISENSLHRDNTPMFKK